MNSYEDPRLSSECDMAAELAALRAENARLREAAGAWNCLVSSPRFQPMIVSEAVAEMRANGIALAAKGGE